MHAPFRHTIKARPIFPRDGDVAFMMPARLVRRVAEEAITIRFITQRRLFGDVYRGVFPDYFWSMPRNSGVFIRPFATTSDLIEGATYPGDVDLLVVPYEGEELILEQTLAIEVKVIRASFTRPGKSPNQYGCSQAQALLDLGFPHVAVAHLIVSDSSPQHAWREMMAVTVLDEHGQCSRPEPHIIDCLPIDLIDRAFGRLEQAANNDNLGLIAAYVQHVDMAVEEQRKGTWAPSCRPAEPNPNISPELLRTIGRCFDSRASWWLDTPRFDPLTGR